MIDAQDIPAFLGPIIVSNFNVAMAQKGYQPKSAAPSDLTVVLGFTKAHHALMSEEHSKNDFSESIGPGANVTFMAIVFIEIFEGSSTDLIWKGHVERFHDVGHGEYMHTGKASIAFYDAFFALWEVSQTMKIESRGNRFLREAYEISPYATRL